MSQFEVRYMSQFEVRYMSQFEVRYMSHAQEKGEATSRDTTSHSQAKTYPL